MRTIEDVVSDLKNVRLIGGDNEDFHVRADELLLEALEILGAGDVVKAFESVSGGFWYA